MPRAHGCAGAAHSLVLDGVYRIENGQPVFHPVAPPTTAELARLLERIVQRVLALLTRRGYWIEDHDTAYLQEPNPDEALGPLQAAACSYRIAMGPRAGRKAMSIRTLEARPSGEGTACMESNGFSLHAGVSCARGERKKLERLCRYIRKSQNNLARLTHPLYLVSSIVDERVVAVLGALDSGKKGVCFSYT